MKLSVFKNKKFWYWFCVVVFFFGIVFYVSSLTGIVTWNKLYSGHFYFTKQAEALLQGRFAISQDPGDMRMDLAWHDGGVQQVWGLGVPVLLVPFVLISKLFFMGLYVPERLIYFIFHALLGVYSFYVIRLAIRKLTLTKNGWFKDAVGLIIAAVIVFFPPVVSMFMSRYQVWEDIVGYLYLVLAYMAVLLIHHMLEPTGRKFIILSILGGLLPHVRPTGLFYIIPTLIIAWLWYQPRKIDRYKVIGLIVGVFLGIMLPVTNYIRFGSPSEFGHAIHANKYVLIDYATVFGSPYEEAKLSDAIKDFAGSVVYTQSNEWKHFYQKDIFSGQTELFRWHEFYFRAFNIYYIIVLWISWSIGAMALYLALRRESEKRKILGFIAGLEVWSFLSVAGLIGFYLWSPGLNSRYFVDFAPAVVIAYIGLAVFLLYGFKYFVRRWMKYSAVASLVVFVLWVIAESVFITDPVSHKMYISKVPPKALTYAEFDKKIKTETAVGHVPPHYETGIKIQDTRILYNGLGWDQMSGTSSPIMLFFVKDPIKVKLTFDATTKVKPGMYDLIEAKIGLEYLKRTSDTIVGNDRIIEFKGPEKEVYQQGVQMLFLKMIDIQRMSVPHAFPRLKKVEWK